MHEFLILYYIRASVAQKTSTFVGLKKNICQNSLTLIRTVSPLL